MPVRVAPDFSQRYPEGSARATESAMNIVRTAALITDRVAKLVRRFDLTPASGLVLGILADAEQPLPPHVISQRLIVTRATVTGIVDSLERRGYARRTPHPEDRRMLLVQITPRGRRIADAMRRLVHGRQRVWFQGLTDAEQRSLVELLGRVQDDLTARPPDAV